MASLPSCRASAPVIAGAAIPASALEFINPKELFAAKNSDTKWVFLADTQKCVGCGFCVKACKTENEVKWDANVTRTWVERYVITKDGKTLIDSPKGARDGFTTQKFDQGHAGMKEVKPEETHQYGVVAKGKDYGESFEITGMVEKPPQGTAPSNLIISGRYILGPEIFPILANIGKGAGGEIQLTDGMKKLAETQNFYGVRFDGKTRTEVQVRVRGDANKPNI